MGSPGLRGLAAKSVTPSKCSKCGIALAQARDHTGSLIVNLLQEGFLAKEDVRRESADNEGVINSEWNRLVTNV